MNLHEADFSTPNRLINALSPADRALLIPHFDRVGLQQEQVLVEPGKPIEQVLFLEAGIASIISDLPRTGVTELGIFGWEGVSGITALLGAGQSSNRTFMQVDGATALRIDLSKLQEAMGRSPTLTDLMMRYIYTTFVQMGASLVATAHHRMDARLARWLLMCHDRVEGNEIRLTHRFMSTMITAQRSGVTVTLHILEGGGAIRSTRGLVTILSREKLEAIAGEGYGGPEAEYRRLIGPLGRSGEDRASAGLCV